MMNTLRFSRFYLLFFLAVAQHSAYAQLRPFEATYSAAYKGSHVGQGVFTVAFTGDQYQLDLHIEPTGLLSVIPFSIKEQASGTLNGGEIRVKTYHYKRRGAGKKSEESVNFTADNIVRKHKGQQETLDTVPNIADPLSTIFKLMHDLNRQQLASQYQVINRGRIKHYQIQDKGEVVLPTVLGKIPTRHIVRKTKKGELLFWFAQQQHFVPVKIINMEKGEEDIGLVLESLQWR